MTADLPHAAAQSLPFQFMTLEILMNVLRHAESPSKLGVSLTQQLRDLTGAHIVILVKCAVGLERAEHEIVAVCPQRRRNVVSQADIRLLVQQTHGLHDPVVWDRQSGVDVREALARMGYQAALAVPLDAGKTRAGTIFFLGLPEQSRSASVAEALKALSPVVAIALRYSIMYQQQEATVEDRTRALAKRVKELDCLYSISNLVEKEDSLRAILQRTVGLLPQAFQYPRKVCARIVLDDKRFQTDNFAETRWKQAREIVAGGEQISRVYGYPASYSSARAGSGHALSNRSNRSWIPLERHT